MNMNTPPLNNSFELQLRHVRKGACLSELSEKLQAAVSSVRALNKPATLTLKLTISPFNDGAFALVDEVNTKLPVPNKGHTLFYATDEGVLVREDPNQTEMKLSITPKPNEEQPATAQTA
jgi:hypothetical protein